MAKVMLAAGDTVLVLSGIIDKEMPIPLSKLMYVCPKCGKPSKIAYVRKNGLKERVCRRCGEMAERPTKA